MNATPSPVDAALAAIAALERDGLLDALDLALAQALCRLSPSPSPLLAWGAALTSQWLQRGHVCFEFCNFRPSHLLTSTARALPPGAVGIPSSPGDWAALADDALVGRAGDSTPLILDGGALYLSRFWSAEQTIVQILQRLCGQTPPHDTPAPPMPACTLSDEQPAAAGQLALDFGAPREATPPPAPKGVTAEQWQAVCHATQHPFSILTGGPGTGKTTTVVQVLAALLLRDPSLRIAVCAPTGKAAARLKESIQSQVAGLEVPQPIRDILGSPELEAATLHRLLGFVRDRTRFRHHAGQRLPHDVVVVDEASMIDIQLMAALLGALRDEARLLLVGDRHQLASVDAGTVFGDLCAAAARTDSRLHGSLSTLTHNFRSSDAPGIVALARAVNAGTAIDARLTASGEVTRIALPHAAELAGALARELPDAWRSLHAATCAEEAFLALHRFQILCATREGPYGVRALNAAARLALKAPQQQEWYPGRPVMITQNDYRLGLFNGDIGIALPDPGHQGSLHVHVESGSGERRTFSPSRLPPHETMYAMTIHKSQGSEAGKVLLILPDTDLPILTRELLYTGITRARHHLTLWASPATLNQATARRIERTSRLAEQTSADRPGSQA